MYSLKHSTLCTAQHTVGCESARAEARDLLSLELYYGVLHVCTFSVQI